jgi:hypothetical protein
MSFWQNKTSGILLPNAQAQSENPVLAQIEIPCSITPIPCSSEEQGIMRNALGLQRKSTGNRTERIEKALKLKNTEMVGSFENCVLISLFSGNGLRVGVPQHPRNSVLS